VCLSVIVNTRQWGGLRQRQLLHHSKNKIAVFSSDRQTTAEAEEHDVQQSVWWAAREHKYGILLCGQNKQHVGRVVTAMLWKIQTKHQIHFLVKVCNPKTCMRFTVVSAVNILQAGSSTFLRNSRSHPQNFQMPYSLIPYVKMLYIYIYIYIHTPWRFAISYTCFPLMWALSKPHSPALLLQNYTLPASDSLLFN